MGGPEEIFQEDGPNGLTPVPGIEHLVVGGIRMAYDGCGIILLGETACKSTVFRVWVGDGFGVSGISPIDASRAGNGR